MKSLLSVVLCCIFMLSPVSVEALFFGDKAQPIDPKLVGTWEGETLQRDGTRKQWTQTRAANGRYTIQFRFFEGDALVNSYASRGKWWMSNGRFCEIGDELSGQHFEYKVVWNSETCVTMTSVKRNPDGDEYEGYTFSECLVESPLN